MINAVSARIGGAATYLHNLIPNLPGPGSGYEFVLFLPPSVTSRLGPLPTNLRLVPTPIGSSSWWRRLWWEQVTLRHFLISAHAELLFSTANFAMFLCPVRQILLVRNSLYFSEVYRRIFLPRHSMAFRLALYCRRVLCAWSVRAADAVMTPTQSMLDEIKQHVPVVPGKALVNPYGAPQTAADLPSSCTEPPSLRCSGSIRLVYVSHYAEHKNLTTLLKALPLLNADHEPRCTLKTTADPRSDEARWTVTHQQDAALASTLEAGGRAFLTGRHLSHQETLELYREAEIFVFPSLTESFGHPMVEAMAYGVPVVAADTPVNREVCGDAALYFSSLDPDDLARAVRLLAGDAQLRDQLARRGRQRVKEYFQWDQHVRTILKAAIAGLAEGSDTALARAAQT